MSCATPPSHTPNTSAHAGLENSSDRNPGMTKAKARPPNSAVFSERNILDNELCNAAQPYAEHQRPRGVGKLVRSEPRDDESEGSAAKLRSVFRTQYTGQ